METFAAVVLVYALCHGMWWLGQVLLLVVDFVLQRLR